MKLSLSAFASLPCVLVLAACSEPTAPVPSATATIASGFTGAMTPALSTAIPNAPTTSCSFSRGTTTCVTRVQFNQTETVQQFSGCTAGPPPFTAGSRIRTFENTYLVTVTTTELRRGQSDHVYSTSVTTDRQLISSTLVSDVCQRM